MGFIEEAKLTQIERESPHGLTSARILELFAEHRVPLSEATLRKYVQLGLLPRSRRVGQKGKHRGSRGVYPVRVVRQILLIKEMMAQQFTIEQIQKEFLFLRGELEQLDDVLDVIFRKLHEQITARRVADSGLCDLIEHDLSEAQGVGGELVERLRSLERRLSGQARELGPAGLQQVAG